ncbi:MAG: hypothetical protein JW801_08030 [Bacteroidales bacterium]|nr:hypothetical protein [Bacteroidales bacterium]
MKFLSFRSTAIVFAMPFFVNAYGQVLRQSIVATGNNHTGTNQTVSYSVRQIACTPIPGENESMIQGIRGRVEIVDLSETLSEPLNIAIPFYPDPVSEKLIMKIDGKDLAFMSA